MLIIINNYQLKCTATTSIRRYLLVTSRKDFIFVIFEMNPETYNLNLSNYLLFIHSFL